jgi:uncharacterized repeat protein (TIGR01451 family)
VNTCGGTVQATATNTTLANTTSVYVKGGTIPLAFSTNSPGKCSIEVNVTKTTTGGYTNSIATNSFTANLGNTSTTITNSAVANAVLTGVASLSLGVNKSISPNNITGGSTARMTIVLTNNSSAAALSGVTFTDNMPAGMLIATQPDLVNTCGGVVALENPNTGVSKLKLSEGAIAPASTCTIAVNITSGVAGNLTNTIAANSITSTEGAVNSSVSSASITFLPFPGISKSFTPNKIAPGRISRLTVKISNFGTTSLVNSSLSDNLPTDLNFATVPNLSNDCPNGNVITFGSQLRLTDANIPPLSSCTFGADVTATIVKSYVNEIPAYALNNSGSNTNPQPATATLDVALPARPGLLLVKRITAINGVAITREGNTLGEYIDKEDNPYDDNTISIPQQILPTDPPKDTDRWSNLNSFLLGDVNGGTVKSSDVVEYTIYFLSTGETIAKNATLCDLIPLYQSFDRTSFNALYATQTGNNSGLDRGLLVFTNDQGSILTNIADGDGGVYYPPHTPLPSACRATNGTMPNNVNGAVVFRLGDLPIASPPNTSPNPASYGYVRFRAVVK